MINTKPTKVSIKQEDKQAGTELCQSQDKLEVTDEVADEGRN